MQAGTGLEPGGALGAEGQRGVRGGSSLGEVESESKRGSRTARARARKGGGPRVFKSDAERMGHGRGMPWGG